MGFGDDWAKCMSDSGMPIITIDSLSDLKDKIEEIHSAWESAGGDEEMLLSALVAAGAVTGIDEGALAAFATLTVVAYLAGCIACLASAAGSALRDLFAESPPQPFMQDQLASLGVAADGTKMA